MPTNVDKKAKTEIQDDSLIDVGTSTSDKSVDVELPEKDVKEVEEKETKDVSVKDKEESEKVEVKEEVKEEVQEEDEHEVYSKNVQDRINKLTKSRRESERREQAATHYAKSVRRENDDLKARMTHVDEGYLSEFSERVKSQVNAVKSDPNLDQNYVRSVLGHDDYRTTEKVYGTHIMRVTDKERIARRAAVEKAMKLNIFDEQKLIK